MIYGNKSWFNDLHINNIILHLIRNLLKISILLTMPRTPFH